MNDFLTWNSLSTYVNFITIVFLVVEFTKEIKWIKRIPTKYWSFFVSFFLLVIINLVNNNFKFYDVILYLLTSISISLSSNGLSDLNKKKEDNNE